MNLYWLLPPLRKNIAKKAPALRSALHFAKQPIQEVPEGAYWNAKLALSEESPAGDFFGSVCGLILVWLFTKNPDEKKGKWNLSRLLLADANGRLLKIKLKI